MANKRKSSKDFPVDRTFSTWTAKEIDQLLEYKATGFKHSEIGEFMGRSTKSINVKLSRIRNNVNAANNPVDNLTPFQKDLDETLFGGVSPDDKPKKTRGPYKPRATKLSLTPQPKAVDAFNVPKKPVYVAVVLILVIVAWYLGSMS